LLIRLKFNFKRGRKNYMTNYERNQECKLFKIKAIQNIKDYDILI